MKEQIDVWDLALEVAAKSKCAKRKVGCLIVDDQGEMVTIGWNRNLDDDNSPCEDSNGNTKANVIHSEDMAYQNLTDEDRNKTLYAYVTHKPCEFCNQILSTVCKEIFWKDLSPKWQEEVEESTEESTVDDLLETRGGSHGPFDKSAVTVQGLKSIMRNTSENKFMWMSEDKREALDMIQHKIGRIIHGDENFKDHWMDIIGYAKLVEKDL